MRDYTIKLSARNEELVYEDQVDRYSFNLRRDGSNWIVVLPPAKSSDTPFTEEDHARVLGRVAEFLARIRWFGIFPRSYDVRFSYENDTVYTNASVGYRMVAKPRENILWYRDQEGDICLDLKVVTERASCVCRRA
jgi:hypothetical protein